MIEEKIRNFLEDHGVYYKERGNAFTIECPYCGKFKLDIGKDEGHFSCYYCKDSNGTKGPSPEAILAEIGGISFRQARRYIKGASFDSILFEETQNQPKITLSIEIPDKIKPRHILSITDPASKPGLLYLKEKRGIPQDIALLHSVQYSPKYRQIIFPVYYSGIYVGYQGRSIDTKLKYNDVEKAKFLMFEDTIDSDRCVLAEGPISALKFAKAGVPFVATMGKSVSEYQTNRLKELGVKRIYLGLDRDAYKEKEIFYNKYREMFEIYDLLVPSHRDDFGDCTFDECARVVEESVPLNKMLILPELG